MQKSEQRVALVTGGAQGIGREIANRLVADGMRVVVADVDAEAVCELSAGMLSADGASAAVQALVADVSVEPDVQRVMAEIEKEFGRLDVLVNNAAIANPQNGPVAQLKLEDWNRILGANVNGPFLCTKHGVPLLRQTGGVIVNIASTRALQSEPNTEAYAASKGALVALTHALAVSLGPDIRVHCISPGWISTEHLQKKSRQRHVVFSDRDHLQHPAGRVGRPEDIAAMVSFLASADAGFITGQNFVIDGGMTKKMIYEE